MTRQEQLQFCKMCTKRAFNPNLGLVCGLTSEVATFTVSCPDFSEDPRELKNIELQQANEKYETKKEVNKGRYVLFILGAINLLYGIYETFVLVNLEFSQVSGIIDSIVGAVFIGLGILSYRKASLSMIIGLIFYGVIILLLALIDPVTIMQGIIWKIVIIVNLSYGIKTSLQVEAENREKPADLLDQI